MSQALKIHRSCCIQWGDKLQKETQTNPIHHVLAQLLQDSGETNHNVERVDAGHVHSREQNHEVGQETAEGGQQSRSRAVTDRVVLNPVHVAATVHLKMRSKAKNAIMGF